MAIKDKVSVNDQMISRISNLASQVFAEHRIRQRFRVWIPGLFASWTCGRDGDSAYRFNITHEPGRLFVTGDIGDLIVERMTNMIAWSRGAVESISYFAEKVPHAIETKSFSAERFREWLDEEAAENRLWRAKLAEIQNRVGDIGDDFYSAAEVYRAIYDSGLIDGCDTPDLRVYNSNFLWCREAVRWWLRHVDNNGTIVKPEV